MSESDLSARKKKLFTFFETVGFGPLMADKILRKKISSRKGPFGHFFEILFFDFSGQNGYQTTPFGPLMTALFLQIAVSAPSRRFVSTRGQIIRALFCS